MKEGELSSVKEMKIKTAAVRHHHQMGYPPDMRPKPIIIFHFYFLFPRKLNLL
ncbi:hypothetical protein EDWATA_00153 [Edwardsiella tarda ATCC 23685]|uniref:Uncharacterized protein n=1 Tax=Edwardsiella tarda ATCC 23685 TaxID=500638 RepID=D4F0C9_EDWTA|nr:hypothetical protein EDWATA_00153 [Edwardsiella tarda ATCC 23685]